jgi:DNA primase
LPHPGEPRAYGTTNHGGCSQSGLYAQWLNDFRDKDVVVLYDNDMPGKKAAIEKAEILLPVAKSVCIVDLPNLPDKKGADVSDWINAGHTAQELKEVIAATPLLTADTLAERKRQWGLTEEEQEPRAKATNDWPEPESI